MDLLVLENFFNSFSLPTVIISISVAIVYSVTYFFVGEKMPKLVKTYLPFIMGIVIFICYDMIFVSRAFLISQEGFYAGVLCGSISIIITTAIKKVKRGERINLSSTALLIQGILEGYLNQSNAVAVAIMLENLIEQANEDEQTSITVEQLAKTITENTEYKFPESELYNLAALILSAVNSKRTTK